MNESVNQKIEIITERFFLRPLVESDATNTYLSWFEDEDSQKYILAANLRQSIQSLRDFIRDKRNSKNVLFLGIFDKNRNVHIGNIKFEPVDTVDGYTIMGIMIGALDYRGKGVAAEVLGACSSWLKINRKISQIILGVDAENTKAISAYKKVGFQEESTPFLQKRTSHSVIMVLRI
jgi:ribosomal-protein-alanine N-acetyltransferase